MLNNKCEIVIYNEPSIRLKTFSRLFSDKVMALEIGLQLLSC